VRRAVFEALQSDPDTYTSHSLRVGFVTEARTRGVPAELIARHTRFGHRRGSPNVDDRPSDLFVRPALDPSWW
jgi:hypothetical protein